MASSNDMKAARETYEGFIAAVKLDHALSWAGVICSLRPLR